MPIDEIAASMRDRMPWPVGRLILEENDVPRGRGWDNTVEKLSNDYDASEETESSLTESLREHLLCGEKLAKFYNVSSSSRATLSQALENMEVPDSSASRKYPLLLSADEIENEDRGLKPIAVQQTESGIVAVFSSIRSASIREPIPDDIFTDELRQELSAYDEIIGVRNIKSQAIDVVYVPSHGQVDVRIDFPTGALSEQIDFASNVFAARINHLAGEEVLTSPQNLFPLIEHMYLSPAEGKVVELAFGTSTQSLKHEKMRRGAVDLRQENYHRGGIAALSTAIEPHRISIEYTRNMLGGRTSKPEVTLAGTYRMAAADSPTLTGAVIRKCTSADDFQYVRARLRHFLRQNAPDGR